VLVPRHVHLAPAKCDTFRFQPEPLLDGVIAAQLNLSASAENPMPR
jgi:hypothetical protein